MTPKYHSKRGLEFWRIAARHEGTGCRFNTFIWYKRKVLVILHQTLLKYQSISFFICCHSFHGTIRKQYQDESRDPHHCPKDTHLLIKTNLTCLLFMSVRYCIKDYGRLEEHESPDLETNAVPLDHSRDGEKQWKRKGWHFCKNSIDIG